MTGNGSATKKCGIGELVIFLLAIVSGTACSLCSKIMMGLHSTGINGTTEIFTKPIFQTFGMFVGMLFGLVMHAAVVAFKIPFPGYEHGSNPHSGDAVSTHKPTTTPNNSVRIAIETDRLIPPKNAQTPPRNVIAKPKEVATPKPDPTESPSELPLWMYFFLAIPSIFDLAATVLCMMGLRYLDVSIYQLLRGSGIIFVALMKQHVLKHRLYTFQWTGVVWNVVSVFLVGSTAILNANSEEALKNQKPGEALLGVMLVMAGAFVQALQFVFEEKVMTMDIPSPPLLLIGMEGLWGTVICLFVIYPFAYYLPGEDHGSYEDPFNTWVMFKNSSTIQTAFVVYFFAIFLYNLFAVLVTFMLNSIWHAILDNFRPITVWCTDLVIFYAISKTGAFGEPWTMWSFIQLLGMFVLLYGKDACWSTSFAFGYLVLTADVAFSGTAVYNAPNAGSIKLEGQWWALGLDFKPEYVEVENEIREQELDAEWENRLKSFAKRKESSFMREMSPHVSIHTQALRGLASPKL